MGEDQHNNHVSVIGGSLLVIGALTLAIVTVTTAISSTDYMAAAVTPTLRPAVQQARPVNAVQQGVPAVIKETIAENPMVPVDAGALARICAPLMKEVRANVQEVKPMEAANAQGKFPAKPPVKPTGSAGATTDAAATANTTQ